MKTKNTKTPVLEYVEFAKAVGKSTLLRIDWRDWEKEQPKNGEDMWVVVKLKDGYYPVRGTYFDEILPPNGSYKESRWKYVRFSETMIPEIYLGSKDAKCLIAWGRNQTVVRLGVQCAICGALQCQC